MRANQQFSVASLCISLMAAADCSNQWHLTGEPLVYGIHLETGQVIDRDVHNGGIVVHKGEIISLMVNTVFIKFLEDTSKFHVLVYAQIHDDGTDNPETAFHKVLYDGENTPAGVNLGVSDRILYGPCPYRGFPLRVKLFIVELDKEEKGLASSLIQSASSLGQSLAPNAAPFVGVAVQLAEAINALNEDDYELRFDLTLYPVAGGIEGKIGDSYLEKLGEPVQRHKKSVFLATPLRTGPYLVIKRELEERLKDAGSNPEATTLFDFAQEGWIRTYPVFGKSGQLINVIQLLRYQGGNLYWVIRTPLDQSGQPMASDAIPAVEIRENPGKPTLLVPGIRTLFHDRTYVVMSLITGLPESADLESLRNSSTKDLGQIRGLLDNPDRMPLHERIGPQVDKIAAALQTAIEQRRIALTASQKSGKDPTFRISTRYPQYWASQLDKLSGDNDKDRHTVSKNAAVLEVLREIVRNFPRVEPDSKDIVQRLSEATNGEFSAIAESPGVFEFTAEGLKRIMGK